MNNSGVYFILLEWNYEINHLLNGLVCIIMGYFTRRLWL